MANMQDLAGALLFAFLAAANFAILVVVARLVGGRRKGPAAKADPFECGFPPSGPLPGRLPVSFYMAGLLVLVFDVLAALLLPWAASFRALGFPGLVAMAMFTAFLSAGYVFVWRRGGFRW